MLESSMRSMQGLLGVPALLGLMHGSTGCFADVCALWILFIYLIRDIFYHDSATKHVLCTC